MPATSTKIVDFDELQRRETTAPIMVKLMMVCNDLSLANESLVRWKEEQSRMQKHRKLGAKMYFVRIQLSHLFEGLKVIEEIRKNSELMALLSQCDTRTQDSFYALERVLPGGTERQKFEKLVGKQPGLSHVKNCGGRLSLASNTERQMDTILNFITT